MTYIKMEYLLMMKMRLQIIYIEKLSQKMNLIKIKIIERKMIQDFNMEVIRYGKRKS